jgi:hypothetical protein
MRMAVMRNLRENGTGKVNGMDEPIERIRPQEAKRLVEQGHALLVCAYEDQRCRDILLENAILRSEFESKLPAPARNQTIIFYCA